MKTIVQYFGVGIQRFPTVILGKIIETDKTFAIKHPIPEAPIHYLVIPKRDIRNAGELSEEDRAYLIDAYAVMGELIRRNDRHSYRVITNGPVFKVRRTSTFSFAPNGKSGLEMR